MRFQWKETRWAHGQKRPETWLREEAASLSHPLSRTGLFTGPFTFRVCPVVPFHGQLEPGRLRYFEMINLDVTAFACYLEFPSFLTKRQEGEPLVP